MRRIWILLILLALGAGAGLLLRWQSDQQPSVPMIPLVPAQRMLPANDGPDVAPASGQVSPGGSERSEPTAAPAADDRIAELVVELLRPTPAAPGVETSRWAGDPLADVEIEVEVGPPADASPPPDAAATPDGWADSRLLQSLTDLQGRARFRIAGGDGRTVLVRCPLAAAAQARLQADATVHVTLPSTPRAVVRGRVVDAAGRGIAGAHLVWLPWGERQGGAPRTRQVGRSRNDGTFELLLGFAGRVGAQHPAYAPSAMFAVPVQPDPTQTPRTTVLELSLLTSPSELQGRVVDAGGAPVPLAQLEFQCLAAAPAGAALAAPPQRVRCAADGSFQVAGLRPGRVEFGVRAAGHAAQRGTLDLAEGAARIVEIRLQPACEVHGRIEDAEGAPVANARVWSGAIDALDGAFAITGADGTFRLRDLAPGPVALTARDGPQATPDATARRAETRLDLLPGRVAHWVATLQAPPDDGLLRGQVVDGDGARLPTWRVMARNAAGAATARTDSGGFFNLRRPGGGLLDIFVHAPGVPATAFADAVQRGVDPALGPARIVVDRRLPWGTVVGRIQASSGQPLPAMLTCWHQERQEAARFQAADDGSFRLDRVPPGTIDLHVEHANQAPLSRLGLVVLPGQSQDLGVLQLEASAVLFGQVVGADGLPPAELQLTLLTGTQRLFGEYSAGTYRFASVPPGRHVLQVQGPSVAAANFVVELQAGIERQQDMELDAGVLRPVVVRAPAAAGPLVSLAVRRSGQAHVWYGATPLQAGDGPIGSCEFQVCMAPGTYEAIAWTLDGWEGHAPVTFAAGDTSPLTIQLVRR